MTPADPDHGLRVAAHAHIRGLQRAYDDLIPREVLLGGFSFEGRQVSYGSLQRGIHRSQLQRGPAALTLFTSPNSPYDDDIDLESGAIVYAYRAGSLSQADNRALDAAFELQAPLIYIKGIEPSQYTIVQPVFVTDRDRSGGFVLLEPGFPIADMAGEGLASPKPYRIAALQDVKLRLDQHRFRRDVLHAYRMRCAVCSLNRRELVQAAHIVEFANEGLQEVRNGLALCAIHHLAYDRNLMGIAPDGVVHISRALRAQRDGPMLRDGLQAFHGCEISQPSKPLDRPNPEGLEVRFTRFEADDVA